MRLSVKSAALTLGLTGTVLASTVATAEAAVPWRNWVRESGNSTGAVFYPRNNSFRIWNNNYANPEADGLPYAFVEWNYVGVNDKWHKVGGVSPRSNAFYTVRLSEKRQIYFRVCHFFPLKWCSGTVRFRVSGGNP